MDQCRGGGIIQVIGYIGWGIEATGLTFPSLPSNNLMALGKALKLSLAIFPALGRQPGLSLMGFLGWEGRTVRLWDCRHWGFSIRVLKATKKL